jgi:hypothetical protein
MTFLSSSCDWSMHFNLKLMTRSSADCSEILERSQIALYDKQKMVATTERENFSRSSISVRS